MDKMKIIFWGIVSANIIGAAYGFIFYYGAELAHAATHAPQLLLFIPDCPLFSLLFAIALILVYYKKKLNWFYFLAAAGAMKYGFWTVFVLFYYSQFYFTPAHSFMYSVLFVTHLGLLIQPVLLGGRVCSTINGLAVAAGFLLLSDVIDYVFGVYPPLPASATGFMFPASVVMSIVFVMLAFVMFRRLEKLIMFDLFPSETLK